jgi:hypothetical protein
MEQGRRLRTGIRCGQGSSKPLLIGGDGFPEKGTTPESGGGTATQSRAVVTTATLASLPILSHPDACAKENRDTQAVPPQSLERVRKPFLASHPR